jgi:hypothetical protein
MLLKVALSTHMKKNKTWRVRAKRMTPQQKARDKVRYAALRRPITLEQVAEFSAHLAHVDYGSSDGCWIFTGKSVAGASQAYARMSHNNYLVMAHRFALAVKLGCTIWDLEGYDAAHASKAICGGGRCCNPEHLNPKPSEPNRSWDRARDAGSYGDKVTTRTPEETRKLLAAMYPAGLAPNSPLFDEPWHSNVSSELRGFLEMGLRDDLRNMYRNRIAGAQGSQ